MTPPDGRDDHPTPQTNLQEVELEDDEDRLPTSSAAPRNAEEVRRAGPGDPLPTSSAAPTNAAELKRAEPREPLQRLGRAERNLDLFEQRQALHERIENDFRYHPPQGPDQTERYNKIRAVARGYAHELVELCPPSRELSLALTKLDEAVMHANSAVARHG